MGAASPPRFRPEGRLFGRACEREALEAIVEIVLTDRLLTDGAAPAHLTPASP
jgi:hypothetical protein